MLVLSIAALVRIIDRPSRVGWVYWFFS